MNAHDRTAARLAEARDRSGLSAAALGERLSPAVSSSAIRRWERGNGGPVAQHRRQLAHALAVPVWELWPPAEVADALRVGARAIVLRAARSGVDGTYVATTTPGERNAAQSLVDAWVAEALGPAPILSGHLYRLTPLGEDVADVLRGAS